MKISFELTPEQYLLVFEELAVISMKLSGDYAEEEEEEAEEPITTPEPEMVIGGMEGPEASLTLHQFVVWQYLKDRSEDCPDGVTVSAVAGHFGIRATTANQRLRSLVKRGYAQRLSRGFYRVAVPPTTVNPAWNAWRMTPA